VVGPGGFWEWPGGPRNLDGWLLGDPGAPGARVNKSKNSYFLRGPCKRSSLDLTFVPGPGPPESRPRGPKSGLLGLREILEEHIEAMGPGPAGRLAKHSCAVMDICRYGIVRDRPQTFALESVRGPLRPIEAPKGPQPTSKGLKWTSKRRFEAERGRSHSGTCP
jgi:hypothetical protein